MVGGCVIGVTVGTPWWPTVTPGAPSQLHGDVPTGPTCGPTGPTGPTCAPRWAMGRWAENTPQSSHGEHPRSARWRLNGWNWWWSRYRETIRTQPVANSCVIAARSPSTSRRFLIGGVLHLLAAGAAVHCRHEN